MIKHEMTLIILRSLINNDEKYIHVCYVAIHIQQMDILYVWSCMSLVYNRYTEINTGPAILVTLPAVCIYHESNDDSDLFYCNLKVKFGIFGEFCYYFLRVCFFSCM